MATANGVLPVAIVRVIDAYYHEPLKAGLDGRLQDIRVFSLTREEALTLAKLVYTHSPEKSLEVGLGAASSAIAIAAARKERQISQRHVSLDPYQETRSSSVGLVEISKAGLKENIEWLPERSEVFFSDAARKNVKYDLVFVDGAHDIGQTVTESFFIHRMLNPNGIVIFHDSLLFSTAAAVRYLMLECNYHLLALKPDSPLKTVARMIRYTPVLGPWYTTRVVPKMYRSLVALQRSN
jgi:predicted O-methyltransferase YrrM